MAVMNLRNLFSNVFLLCDRYRVAGSQIPSEVDLSLWGQEIGHREIYTGITKHELPRIM